MSQIRTKSALHKCMVQVTSHSNRFCDHREMQHLRKCWIPLKDAQLQASPWQESSTFSRRSLRNRLNRNGTACPSQTQKGFPCCIRRLEWYAFQRKNNSLEALRVSQERAIEELEEIPAPNLFCPRSLLYLVCIVGVQWKSSSMFFSTKRDTVPVCCKFSKCASRAASQQLVR